MSKWERPMKSLVSAVLLLGCANAAYAQNAVPVTVDNFIRAESDLYFPAIVKDSGSFGKFTAPP